MRVQIKPRVFSILFSKGSEMDWTGIEEFSQTGGLLWRFDPSGSQTLNHSSIAYRLPMVMCLLPTTGTTEQ